MTRRGLTATDRLLLGYVALNSIILVWRSAQVGAWQWLLLINGATVALVALLARAPGTGTVHFLGGGYAVLLTGAFYTQLGLLGVARGRFHDALVQRWEAALFGSQVSVAWHEAMPSVVLSWLMHGSYWAYFAMVPGVMVVRWLRAGRESYDRAGFIIALGFYTCYLVFSLFPVAGPRYFFGDATGPIAEVWPARLMRDTQQGFAAMGTAFPSSHVSAAWCAVYALWRDQRKLAMWLAPVAAGLALGTVYGQFHYAVDALAGAALAALLCLVADPLRRSLAPALPRPD